MSRVGRKLAKSEKAWEDPKSSNAFSVVGGGRISKRQCFAAPPEASAELSTFVQAQIIESEWWLLLQGQLWFQSQDFLFGCNPPGRATLHDASEVLTSAKLEQAIFGKLLVGHAALGTLVHVPGPSQHFVSQVLVGEMIISFLPAQQIPQGHQQLAGNRDDRLVGKFALA